MKTFYSGSPIVGTLGTTAYTADEVTTLLESTHHVAMPLGCYDFSEGANFLFVVIPNKGRGKGMRWHKDFHPALKTFIDERFPDAKKIGYLNLISAIDGYEDEDGRALFQNRAAGDNDRLWVAYRPFDPMPSTGRRGEIVEIKFDQSKPHHPDCVYHKGFNLHRGIEQARCNCAALAAELALLTK